MCLFCCYFDNFQRTATDVVCVRFQFLAPFHSTTQPYQQHESSSKIYPSVREQLLCDLLLLPPTNYTFTLCIGLVYFHSAPIVLCACAFILYLAFQRFQELSHLFAGYSLTNLCPPSTALPPYRLIFSTFFNHPKPKPPASNWIHREWRAAIAMPPTSETKHWPPISMCFVPV